VMFFCGQAPLNTRIVGGVDASEGSWPWQVSLHSSNFEYHFCGGSLINSEWVLPAAHCLPGISASSLLVYLGKRIQNVSSVIVHLSYNSQSSDNDIALLRLSSAVTFNEYIRPVCLAGLNSSFPSGTSSWVTCWRNIQSGATDQCNALLGSGSVTSNMMCGLMEGGRDTWGFWVCPMVSKQCSVWVQSGITSRGYGCAEPNAPGVYTCVSQYQSWITNKTGQNLPGFVIYNPSSTCQSVSTASPISDTSTRFNINNRCNCNPRCRINSYRDYARQCSKSKYIHKYTCNCL
uniref:Peptidase S1 domain-containing protein n=1 Tax=Sinocyclocheilus grahami TaxID=75366 RepID=A0A672PYQ4_SINGR